MWMIALCLGLAGIAPAQEAIPVAATLAEKRAEEVARFESALDAARAELARALAARRRAAEAAGDREAAARLEEEQRELDADGALPCSVPDAVIAFEERVRAALDRADRALSRLAAGFRSQGLPEAAADVDAEREALCGEDGALRWNDLLARVRLDSRQDVVAGSWERSGRALVSVPALRCELRLPAPEVRSDYDLELELCRAAGSEPVEIFAPVDGVRIALAVDDGVEGFAAGEVCRVLLQVRSGRVSLHAGERALIDDAAPTAFAVPGALGPAPFAIACAEGSAVEVSSARLRLAPPGERARPAVPLAKPGVAPQPPRAAPAPAAVRAVPAPEDPYHPGRTWLGSAPEGGRREIRLVGREGDRAIFHVEGRAPGALFRIAGPIRDGHVSVDDIDRIKNPKGAGAIAVSRPRGRIQILADGRLTMHCVYQYDAKKRKSISGEIRFSGAKPK